MSLEQLKDRWRRRARRHILDALDERGLQAGLRLEFPRAGTCALVPFEEAGAGRGELLVETLCSVVSVGTEQAVYSGRAGAAAVFPYVPGYCLAGHVVQAQGGAGAQVGQRVATAGPHASLHLCAASKALLVPEGVSTQAAAAMQQGVVALQGVRRAALRPGQRVLVLGAGLIGQIAAQAARIAGADVTLAARSPERLAPAEALGLRVRPVAAIGDGFDAAVVFDVTGNPAAIHDALRAAAPHGRVVLLGSSRGRSDAIDAGSWARKAVTLVGAHTNTIPQADDSEGSWTWRREAETYLALLADGRLQVAPLLTRRVAPDAAPALFEALAAGSERGVGIVIDWTAPGPWRARLEKASPLRGAVGRLRRAAGRPGPKAPSFLLPRADGRRLRFGLVGCGEIAAENAAALGAAGNATISFAADPVLDLARGLAAWSGARASADVADLLASDEVDAVLISTPHHLHAPLAIRAAESGKHVVVEKPMATSVADCDRMIEAARRAGVVLSVCYCQRYDPRVVRARQLMAAGAVGEILGSRISFGQWRGDDYYASGLAGRTRSDWRARPETAGGGVLIMNACHILDFMGHLIGSPVVEVAAHAGTLRQGGEVEDIVAASYRYASGALGSLDATTRLVGPWLYEQQIWGREGRITVAPQLRFWSQRTVEGYEAGDWHEVRSLPRPAERRQFFEAFAEAVLSGSAPPVAAHEARAVQAVIAAAYASASSGAAVRVS